MAATKKGEKNRHLLCRKAPRAKFWRNVSPKFWRKMRRKNVEMFRQFSSFNFQEKWAQEISQKWATNSAGRGIKLFHRETLGVWEGTTFGTPNSLHKSFHRMFGSCFTAGRAAKDTEKWPPEGSTLERLFQLPPWHNVEQILDRENAALTLLSLSLFRGISLLLPFAICLAFLGALFLLQEFEGFGTESAEREREKKNKNLCCFGGVRSLPLPNERKERKEVRGIDEVSCESAYP